MCSSGFLFVFSLFLSFPLSPFHTFFEFFTCFHIRVVSFCESDHILLGEWREEGSIAHGYLPSIRHTRRTYIEITWIRQCLRLNFSVQVWNIKSRFVRCKFFTELKDIMRLYFDVNTYWCIWCIQFVYILRFNKNTNVRYPGIRHTRSELWIRETFN